MVVTGGSCSEFFTNCSHIPPYCTSSKLDISREVCRNEGWCTSLCRQENVRHFNSFSGRRVGHKHFLKLSKKVCLPCVTGDCRKVLNSQLSLVPNKVLVAISLGGKPRVSGHIKKGGFLIRSHGERVSGEMHSSKEKLRGQADSDGHHVQGHPGVTDEEKCGTTGCEKMQTEIPEEISSFKDRVLVDTGEHIEQGKIRLVNWPPGVLPFDEIPSTELLKIQELKFSGDMWEGDSGPQVLDLQRALYWFGYLPKRTALTAYFGLETKRALQQFQTAHGVLGTGVWASSSRQALWKLLSAESSQLPEVGSNLYSNIQTVSSSGDALSFQNLKDVGGREVGIHVTELLNMMSCQGKDFIATVSSTSQWRLMSANMPRNAAMVGLLVGVVFALFGLGFSVFGVFQRQPGQPVRRRVMKAHWRDDMTGRASTKTKKHLQMFPGLDLPLVGEEEFRYPNYQLRSKSKPSTMDGIGRTDRLIMYEGQVIVGDSNPSHVYPFRNDPTRLRGIPNPQMQPKSNTSVSTLSSSDQSPKSPATNGSFSGAYEDVLSGGAPKQVNNVRFSGGQGEGQRNVKSRSDGMATSSQKTFKNNLAHPIEQSQQKQPNFIRNVLSALFTPRGLGQPVIYEIPVKTRTSSRSQVPDARNTGREDLVERPPGLKAATAENSARLDGSEWRDQDELKLRDRMEELRKTVQAAEQNRQAAMRALAEERQRSLELQVKISRQKEAAVALEEEVRVLKESHDALLASLRKKYSSSVAARAAAALLYQNWDTNHEEEGSAQPVSF